MATQIIPDLVRNTVPGYAPVAIHNGRRKKSFSSPCQRARRHPHARSAKAPGLKPISSQEAAADYIPLVKHLAYQMRGHLPAQVDVNELISEGMLGLVDALQKFDATKQVKFESYARHRIRGAILDGLRNLDPASRDMRRRERILHEKRREMEGRLGRGVTDSELAQALGCSLERFYDLLRDLQAFSASPDAIYANGEVPINLAEFIVENRAPSAFEMCYRREQQEIMRKVLRTLPEKEQMVLKLYYYGEVSMKDIAAQMGVDQSRVSQLHSTALAKLRRRVGAYLGRVPQRYQAHSQMPNSANFDQSSATSNAN
jgi:RNA polymerase sigma factor FliA